MHTINWIREKFEWSMGVGGDKNEGQCPVCDAVSLAWRSVPGGWGDRFGHKRHCKLAKALKADACDVIWDRKYLDKNK